MNDLRFKTKAGVIVTLCSTDMQQIAEHYKIHSEAEYISENYETTIIYGYGVGKETLSKISTGKLVEFLKNHNADAYKQMCSDMEDFIKVVDDDYNNWLNYCECDNSGMCGRYSIIANAMSDETGIRFEFQDGEYDGPCIIFSDKMPWHLNEVEKELTQEKLDEILLKYFTELGLESADIITGSYKAEYYD